MAFELETAQSLSFSDASEAEIQQAFDDDAGRGEFAILTAPGGDFIQAAGEDDGPYVLEYRLAATGEHYSCEDELNKQQVREAFLAFRRGDDSWRTSRQWMPLASGGCLSCIAVALTALAALARFA